jgi:2-methylcitrate dehydratase PrpD
VTTLPLAPTLDPVAPAAIRDQSLSGALAAFGTDLTLERVPAPVVAHAKLLLLDTLGAALAGVDTAEGRAVLDAAHAVGGDSGPATLWGTARRTTRAAAALANGTIAHAQELDDFGGCDHSGAVVVPAALAAAEGHEVSGRQVLEALVVGYDVARRVLDAAGGYRAHNGRGFHSTGTCGGFGAAAAAAKVLGLDRERTAWALGLAGSYTGGLWAFIEDGAMAKRYHPGRAAETGVLAAFLARAGFTGPARIFEASWGGFLSTYAGDDAEPAELTAGLGEDFRILRSGVKRYASCGGTHSTLDVVLDIRRREKLGPDQVQAVRIRCTEADRLMVGGADPRSRLAAQMSLPYSVAVAWVAGRASLAEYEERWRNDPAVRAFLPRVRLEVDAGLPEGSEPYVTVESRDGRSFTGHVPVAPGLPDNPLGREEVVAKYEELAGRALAAEDVRVVKEAVLGLEESESLGRLVAALGRPR